MFPGLRDAIGVIEIIKNKGVLSEIRNRCTDIGETWTSSIKVCFIQNFTLNSAVALVGIGKRSISCGWTSPYLLHTPRYWLPLSYVAWETVNIWYRVLMLLNCYVSWHKCICNLPFLSPWCSIDGCYGYVMYFVRRILVDHTFPVCPSLLARST
jgi:hypothetical protein